MQSSNLTFTVKCPTPPQPPTPRPKAHYGTAWTSEAERWPFISVGTPLKVIKGPFWLHGRSPRTLVRAGVLKCNKMEFLWLQHLQCSDHKLLFIKRWSRWDRRYRTHGGSEVSERNSQLVSVLLGQGYGHPCVAQSELSFSAPFSSLFWTQK